MDTHDPTCNLEMDLGEYNFHDTILEDIQRLAEKEQAELLEPELLPEDEPNQFESNLLPTTQTKTLSNKWDPRLILDLAVGVDGLQEILDRYGLSMDAYERLAKSKEFMRELSTTVRDIKENGVSFYQKAKIQAESYLDVLDELVYDKRTPASVRLETIRSTVLWAKLVPKDNKEEAANATQINVNISF